MSEPARIETAAERPETPAFIVDSDSKADWCLRKIAEKKAELETWKAHYKALYAAVEKEIAEDVDYFRFQLEKYFRRMQAEGFTKSTKTQTSYPLPSGKLLMKRQEPEYELDDEALLGWLEKNAPEMIRVKREPDWKELKKKLIPMNGVMITADAEVVPGITVTERDDKFTWEVK